MNNYKLPKAVIISNDIAMQNRLSASRSESKNLLSVVLSNDSLNLSPKIEADAYIYDVGVPSDNLVRTVSNITDLKQGIFNKPLILVGDKNQINNILRQEGTKGIVSQTISTPFTNGQLLSAIKSCSLDKRKYLRPFDFLYRPWQRQVIGMSLSVLFLLLYTIFIVLK